MNISIGSDHRGHEQRKALTEILESLGHTVDDQGCYGDASCDYPDIAVEVCKRVTSDETAGGILVCGTGIGMSIAANKVDGIRAALVSTVADAELATQHNNANIICLAGNDFDVENYRQIVTAWLGTTFEGGRHERRLSKVHELEK
jgi:ribose 5-phosphate isomerase B